MPPGTADPVLEVKDLSTLFRMDDCTIYAVNGVSFQLRSGELLAIVGESGSGKSVTAKSVLGLIPSPPGEIVAGSAVYEGRELISAPDREIREIRGNRIGFVFQDPMTSLNPVLTIGRQLTEPMTTHLGMSRSEARVRAIELLDRTGIPDAASKLQDYPHQFSGGMRQRVMIAIALSCNPDILIADEPTTALDVTIQAQIIELVKDLRKEFDMSIIWITHDLGVVAGIADRVLVMYGGCIIERAPVTELYASARHPYTRGLLGSIPDLGGPKAQRLASITGQAPVMTSVPGCCPFLPRCPYRHGRCETANPALKLVDPDHDVACWLNNGRGIAPNE
jgi:oligopeptide/dipeptide ABC transporter ATP-binding protein